MSTTAKTYAPLCAKGWTQEEMVDEVEIGRAPDSALDKRDGEMMLTILPVDKMRKLFPALFLNGVSSETGFGRTFCVFPFKVWGI